MTARAERPTAPVDDEGSVRWTLFVATVLVGVIFLAGIPFVFDVLRGAMVWLEWVK